MTDAFPATRNNTFFAHWKIDVSTVTGHSGITFTVKFFNRDISGNSGDEAPYFTQEVPYGSTPSSFPTPSRAGYVFRGWYDRSTNSPVRYDKKIFEDMEVEAAWELVKYPIEWDMNGVSALPSGSIPNEYSVEMLPFSPTDITVPSQLEYVFVGWQPSYIPLGTFGPWKFVAQWETRLYNVTLDAGDGALPEGA